jgi:hypothetical protein
MTSHKKSIQRRGQIQLGETTAVIIIVIIMLMMGIIFWNKVSNSNVKQIDTQSQELSVIEIANNVPELPELKCSELKYKEVKCLDLHKLLAMSQVINNPNDKSAFEFYNNYFKNSKITIIKMYPSSGADENITLYDAKLNNSIRKLLIPIPVNIKDYVNKETYYGLIIVEGYYNG